LQSVTRTRRSVSTGPFAEALALPKGPRLCLLGTPALVAGTRRDPLALRPKAIALLTYLALSAGEVARHELARLLFPEAEGALATLRWHLAHLRSAAPPVIGKRLTTTRDGIELAIGTDAALFQTRADTVARRPMTPGAAQVLALYRGDLVDGLSVSAAPEFDNWLYVAQEGCDAASGMRRSRSGAGHCTRAAPARPSSRSRAWRPSIRIARTLTCC